MNVLIVDDFMIDSWNWKDVTIENLSFIHIKGVQRELAQQVSTILYVGEKHCKILKDRYMSDVEKFNGRIFSREYLEKFINESIIGKI